MRLPYVLLTAFLFIAAATFQVSATRIIDTNEYGAHVAIRNDDIAKVRHYLQNKPDLRKSCHLLLHCACDAGKTEIAE
ncbi:MAG: hypothetical protein AB2L14_19705 [Candidatus Xenobiia bacterium LiM19]